jgi:hypothetical protein
MNYIVEDYLVDTYGGNFTYMDMWWKEKEGKFYVYESYSGVRAWEFDMGGDWVECFNTKEELNEFISLY